ncbi:hypothetical protein A3F52_02240 [Candidatus Uhrbacteria bacterium RIFCSPHIGHO2_12_FULL_47_11]|nr:MAG: hypothetical protein A3F52_02240 [Candidatus Uhrbacteria bacterium RIFCSPHIGHO2_12_FULL_47_11]
MLSRFARRITISALLVCFSFVFVVATVFAPRPVFAIPTEEALVSPVAIYATQEIKENIEFGVWDALWASALMGLVNTVTLMGQQLAYDLAVGLASGCKGENACFEREDWGTYLTSVAYDGAGEFIGTLAENPIWGDLGFSLCGPALPNIALSIALGLAERFQRPKPKCDFVQTLGNWQNFSRQLTSSEELLKHASLSFDSDNTDLGQAFKANEEFRIVIKRKKEEAANKRKESEGILPQSGIISGNITTPSTAIKSKFDELAKEKGGNNITTGDITSGLIGSRSGAVWSAVGTTILSTFTNTLISRVLKSIMAGLVSDEPTTFPNLASEVGGPSPSAGVAVAPGLSPVVASLLTPQIRVSNGGFDYVTELGSCPTGINEQKFATQFQCTIDTKFMAAIQQALAGTPLTVSEAVQKGYLERNRPFGYISPANEGTPNEGDYLTAYPNSSLKKLRLLRIIPLGWEFAAQRILQDASTASTVSTATFGDVLDGYTKEGDSPGCQGKTADPAEDRFCGLVDPNWVLDAPPATCGAIVSGASLDGLQSGRQDTCADLKHCVAEDNQGGCQAWGYCTRERNTWRFDADTCDKQYASCDTFTPKEGSVVSILENTVDFGSCNAENAGCTALLTAQTPAGTWDPNSSRLYLDRDAPKCDATNEGCTEFISSPAPNLIKNPGFEKDDVAPTGAPDDWLDVVAAGQWSSDGAQSFEGRGAIKLSSGAVHQANIPIQGGLTYAISLSAKGGSDITERAHALVRLSTESSSLIDLSSADTTCTLTTPGNDALLEFAPSTEAGNTTSYVRRSCRFTAPQNAVKAQVFLLRSGSSTILIDIYADAVQLEAGAQATNYREGYGTTTEIKKSYYRIPPDYLGCTGEANQNSLCEGYTRYCRGEEVGCELYTPSGLSPAAGLSPISAIATALDKCPGECVGYDTYLKLPSKFEPAFTRVALQTKLSTADLDRLWPTTPPTPQEDLYPIIPQKSTVCNAENDGCEEFTNLRTEQRQYYSDLRACQVPAPDSQTYFTWEGSDTTGYQLKTWSFKRSNRSYSAGNDLIKTFTAGPAIPPCTNYSVTPPTTTGGIVTVNCEDNTATDAGTNQAICDPAPDSDLTPEERTDCRAFYDANGNIFNRFLSRTIISTDECQSFRWTGLPRLPEIAPKTGETPDALRLRLEETACLASHGSWDGILKQCLYLGAPSLSKGCSAALNGCRGFKGNTGSNIAQVFSEDFESITTPLSTIGWPSLYGEYSSEALTVQGHSLKNGSVPNDGGTDRRLNNPTGASPLLTPGGNYFVSFNAKGTAGSKLRALLKNHGGTGAPEDIFGGALGAVALTPDWQRFELGPLALSTVAQADILPCPSTGAVTVTASTPCSIGGEVRCTIPQGTSTCNYLNDPKLLFRNVSGSTATFYLDDVILREVRDTVYLVKNSSRIPASCDTLSSEAGGGYLRGAMLGCREYKDRAGTPPQYLKSFSSLCRKEAVGCTDLIDTRGLDSQYSQQFNTTNSGICRGAPGDCFVNSINVCDIGTDETYCSYNLNLTVDDWTVPNDLHRFVVIDKASAKACNEKQKGCTAFAAESAPDITLRRINNPNKYNETLCTFEAGGCEAWTRSDNSPAYFKNPGASGCEWKTNVAIGAGTYLGWFRAQKQPVVDGATDTDPATLAVIYFNTKEECQGFGAWNFVTGTCVDPGGNTLDPGECGGVDCNVETCTKGAGGKWKQLTPTTGQCEAETPCYGAVTVEDLEGAPGGDVRPRVKVDVINTYLIGGTTFGLWQNADPSYGGKAGACPAPQATCTALTDPTDVDVNGVGKTYYLKDNTRLIDARSACKGQVSRAQGCVLFDNKENPSKLWSAEQTYFLSDAQRGALVNTVSSQETICVGGTQHGKVCVASGAGVGQVLSSACTGGGGICRAGAANNTNTVLKVQRDRVCAEWFQCASARFTYDDQLGRFKTVCDILGRCNASAATPEEGSVSINTCGSWVPRPLLNLRPQVDPASCANAGFDWDGLAQRCTINDSAKCGELGGIWHPASGGSPSRCELGILKETMYRLRDRTFSGQDYTGYSIANLYRIDQLQEVNVGTREAPKYVLAHVLSTPCTPGSGAGGCLGSQDCTADGRCVISPDGVSFNTTHSEEKFCRAYPERASPFPKTENTKNNLSYENIKLCENEVEPEHARELSDSSNCECKYQKVEYGGETRYFPLLAGTAGSSVEIPDNLCVGFPAFNSTKLACETAGGTWQTKGAARTVIGLAGYCLEDDMAQNRSVLNGDQTTYPCLTWLPVDQLPSEQDIYARAVQASYTVGNPDSLAEGPYGRYYCLLGGESSFERIKEDIEFRALSTSDGELRALTYDMRSKNIYRYDIQRVVIRVNGKNGSNTSERDGEFSINPGTGRILKGSYNATFPAQHTDGDVEISDEAFYMFDMRFNPEEAWWAWGADNNFDGESGNDRGPNEANEHVMTNKIIPLLKNESSFPLMNNGNSAVSCEADGTWDDVGVEQYEGAFVLLNFDNETQKLLWLRLALCNTGGGSYPVEFDVNFHYHPHCDYIAKIDEALGARASAPDTEKLWSQCGSGDAGSSGSGGGNGIERCLLDGVASIYLSNKQPTPFASSLGQNDPPTALNSNPWFLNHNRLDSFALDVAGNVVPFAGWPWACADIEDAEGEGGIEDCAVQYLAPSGSDLTGEITPQTPPLPVSDEETLTVGTVTRGIARFEKLFAKSSGLGGLFGWSTTNKWYFLAGNTWDNRMGINTTGLIAGSGSSARAPQIRAAIGTAPSLTQGSATEPLAINGEYAVGSQVIGVNGFLVATARYFAFAADQHLPIRRMRIDWDDGYITGSADGLYKNAKAAAPGTTECKREDTTHGLGTSSRACQTEPYTVEHLYSCAGTDDPNWETGVACPSTDFKSLYGGCCVFNPKIQVVDNWGFCNGTCPGDVGLANDAANCIDVECDEVNPVIGGDNPWTPFAGNIVIAP